MIVRTKEERESVIEAGRRFGMVLEAVAKAARAGVTTRELDALAEKLIRAGDDEPAFKGFRPDGAKTPFPSALCVSINDEVVHGIPGDRVLKEGDIVSLDLGLTHEGFIMDSAVTVPIGSVPRKVQKLLETTQRALYDAITAARPGKRVGDISYATESAFKGSGFSVVKVLGGHGVGREVHEEPFIANIGHPGTGPELKAGMVLALEPIANLGKASVLLSSDGYTYRTRDGSLSAHFEHTILVDENGALILTRRPHERIEFTRS